MSISVMVKVWECEEITDRTELLLLLAMADFADKKGTCFPSVSTLAKLSRISDRQAHRVIKQLCDKKWIELVQKGGVRNGKNFSNRYRILIEGGGVTMTPRTDTIASPGAVTPLRHTIRHSEPPKETTTTISSVVVASSWPAEEIENLKLSAGQKKQVQRYLDQNGQEYILEKLKLIRSKDLRNAGGFFIRALEEDYKEPVRVRKEVNARKETIPEPHEEPVTDEERDRVSGKFKELLQTLSAS